jgi:hypothetical protein
MPKCPQGETFNRTIKACRTMKKRGRKPQSSKYDCPPGQTYNRTIKACRTMKKRGRPAKVASPNAPMPPSPRKTSKTSPAKNLPALPSSKKSSSKRITFTMHVAAVSRMSREPLSNNAHSDKIIDWYLPYIYDFDLGTNPSMTYDKKTNEYTVSFTPGDDFPEAPKDQLFELEGFADPDDDGNHPIRIGNTTYLVQGELMTLNGKKLVDGSRGKEFA